VVGSDIPEIAKAQISSGKDGYTFKEGNSKELADRLEKLLKDLECISRIGIEARKKVENNWSTEIVDKAYRNLYMSI